MALRKITILCGFLSVTSDRFAAAAPTFKAASATDVADTNQIPYCRNVLFTAYGKATNRNFSAVALDTYPPVVEAVLADEFQRIEVSGKQVISGLFCEPTVKNSNNDRLQIAMSQLVGNRNYWNALGGNLGFEPYQPQNYSWVRKMPG